MAIHALLVLAFAVSAGSFKETLKRAPDSDLKVAQAWAIEKGQVGALYVRLKGVLPLHRHPDGAHRLFVLEGKIRLEVGKDVRELGPGDYALIPKGAPHRTASLGRKPALYGTVDVPAIDSKTAVTVSLS